MCSLSRPKITLYTEKDFRGCCLEVNSPVYSLCSSGFNNRASSVVVHSGLWVLYENNCMGGKIYVVWEGQRLNLPCGVNDTISSLKPIHLDFNERPSCTLYEHGGFSGRHQNFGCTTKVPDLGAYCFDNIVSSVTVCGGAWIGYEHKNFEGKQYLFLKGSHNFSASEGCFQNDAISSLAAIV